MANSGLAKGDRLQTRTSYLPVLENDSDSLPVNPDPLDYFFDLQPRTSRIIQLLPLLLGYWGNTHTQTLGTPGTPETPPQPACSPAQHPSLLPSPLLRGCGAPEPRIGNPERFSGPTPTQGVPGELRVQFTLQPRTFATEGARVGYVITHLTGRARLWGTAEFERQTPACATFNLFAEEMLKDPGPSSREGARVHPPAHGVSQLPFCPHLPHRLASRTSLNRWRSASLLTPAERQRRITSNLCLYCGGDGHRVATCPAKGRSSPDVGGIRMSSMNIPPSISRKPLIQVCLHLSDSTHTLAALVDSGAEANIIDTGLARQLGLESHRLSTPVPARALDGHVIGTVTNITAPISMMVSGNHRETIRFHLLSSPGQPLILGYPWLRLHNPHLNWASGTVKEWGNACHLTCLRAASLPSGSVPPSTAPDISNVPECYHGLREVFNKTKATSLPPTPSVRLCH
ncbi:hypothetical protein AALO_G00176750 [Alosa alosa]|uniref:Uncharacterized protein n=1 Tax=Alosa alosa TaxID=278164 RepID=A0AAV6G7U8_9TELE|nr:hypothetical protein AALO_G00176750 [Alosa alosa]